MIEIRTSVAARDRQSCPTGVVVLCYKQCAVEGEGMAGAGSGVCMRACIGAFPLANCL
jgi:hypothetical protein